MDPQLKPPDLNTRQQEAAHAPETPLLIVAGAGTGKTKTLTNRLVHLIKKGVEPRKICALTFTNKAAGEMLDRVDRLIRLPGSRHPADSFGAPRPFVGTFHSFGARILRQEARHLGRTAQFVIFDDHDSFQIIKKLLVAEGIDKESAGPGDVYHAISAIKNKIIRPEELASHHRRVGRIALELLPKYEGRLAAMNAFDFDDLIEKVVVLFESHPEIVERYRQRFEHFLVDEYQDLNNRQYELIRLLAEPTGRLSVVGDDQQTIYGWRGSNIELFLDFEKHWPKARVVTLDQNYRSTGTIVAAASAMIQHNHRQKPKHLWTEHAHGTRIKLLEAGDEEQEAFWIAESILEARAANPKIPAAVLYRTNAQSRPIEQAFIERAIPYRVYGGLKFYERREIKDLVAALRYAVNPKDEVSKERLEKAFSKTVFRRMTEELSALRSASPVAVINRILELTDYTNYARKNLTNFADRLENIAELVRFATEFDDLTLLIERIALLQATDDASRKEQGTLVALMTIHLAKGLEFDRVFVAGCVEGLLPHARSLSNDAELEEERRLMYVAMTRAREHLALSFYDIPSRFLSEIPSEHLEFQSLISDDSTFSDGEERYITMD